MGGGSVLYNLPSPPPPSFVCASMFESDNYPQRIGRPKIVDVTLEKDSFQQTKIVKKEKLYFSLKHVTTLRKVFLNREEKSVQLSMFAKTKIFSQIKLPKSKQLVYT